MQELKSYVNRRNQMGWTALLLAAQNGFDSSLAAILVPADRQKDFEDVMLLFQDIQKAKHVFHFRYQALRVSVLVLKISVGTPKATGKFGQSWLPWA